MKTVGPFAVAAALALCGALVALTIAVGLIACAALFASPADAQEMGDEAHGVECGKPCVVQDSIGGQVEGFRLQGLKLLFDKTPIIVDGYCGSACTLMVDVAHANVCITTNAVFAYHQESWNDAKGVKQYGTLVYETPGLNVYIAGRGGLPREDVMLVPFDYAKAFYRPCPGADSAHP